MAGVVLGSPVGVTQMKLQVYGETTSHSDEPLCRTCTHSRIIRGRSLDEEIIECRILGYGHRRITFRVTSCSDYTDARLPSIMELMENAWVLRRGSKRRPAGFIHGKDVRAEELLQMMSEGELGDGDDPA
jgi:hypothetical protein